MSASVGIRNQLAEAMGYVASGEFALAESCYASALEDALQVDDDMATKILGFLAKTCASQDGKTQMAVAMYERQLGLVTSQADRASIRLELASLYRKLGRDDDADRCRALVALDIDHLQPSSSSEEEDDDVSGS